MNWNDFAAVQVRIEYANMAKINKVRAWVRRNHASIQVSRYAKDAYEGMVKIYMNEGRDQQQTKVAELKALLAA